MSENKILIAIIVVPFGIMVILFSLLMTVSLFT